MEVGILMSQLTERKQFPNDITFCYPWRSYQERILHELDEHLANNHLHLVAPPGSGKTVLGLEVMLRLNKPTIILAPTLTIKNQWEQRFTELFLQQPNTPEWISMHIKEPAFVTITTYQALYSLYSAYEGKKAAVIVEEEEGVKETIDQAEIGEIFAKLDQLQFQTVILDEAHHLRTAWWKSLMAFRERLTDYAIVALTATPPYDVSLQEWERYEQLCGPIDAEIHVAELVREGDLCPHQDYIYISEPQKEERKRLKTFHKQVKIVHESLINSTEFQHAIEQHPWMVDPNANTEKILDDPAFFSSMVIYLHHANGTIHEDALELLGLQKEKIPKYTLDWAELLLNGMNKDLFFEEQSDYNMKQLTVTLKRIGALEKGTIYLRSTPTNDQQMMHSTSKFSSIEKIAHMENRYLGEDLRMVILTDYIRREMLMNKEVGARLGVVPIFQLLQQALGEMYPLAVLTGSLVIIPRSACSHLEQLAADKQIDITFSDLRFYDSFVTVDVTQSNRAHIVQMMTTLFTEGHIRILIGTAALLGEGWDAPCINSLIMASYVGSFMLSNQMRGRAIRTDRANPHKTSAIWHLACIDPALPYGGFDMFSLQRRFRSLVGLHARIDVIETGLDRVGEFITYNYTSKKVKRLNEETMKRASNREQLTKRWHQAVYDTDGEQEVQLRMDKTMHVKPYIFPYTLKALLYGLYYAVLVIFTEGIMNALRAPNVQVIRAILLVTILIAFIVSLPKLWKIIRLALRYRSLEKYMQTVGEILYDSLYTLGHVQTEPQHVLIDVDEVEGLLICKIRGGKMYEKNLMMTAWSELLEPIQNPRYILKREPKKIIGIKQKADYLAVPEEIGKRKEDATVFCEKWNEQLEGASIHYTRTPKGRSMLIKARLEAIAMNYVNKTERISVWK